jgi:hypothetical protein
MTTFAYPSASLRTGDGDEALVKKAASSEMAVYPSASLGTGVGSH